jgi:hypothetical protein
MNTRSPKFRRLLSFVAVISMFGNDRDIRSATVVVPNIYADEVGEGNLAPFTHPAPNS